MDKATAAPSRQSQRGLDWFIFFLADVQTGFGPFIAVYLTTEKWTQAQIGLVLSIGGVVGLIGQMPGGAIVDAARSERLVAGLAVATIGMSALAYALWPIFPVVTAAATLHAAASCVLGPAIAAISLGLVGPPAMGERLGRNARFASLGNGTAAAVMGTAGYLLSSRSVFLVTFILALPDFDCAFAHPRARDRRRPRARRGAAGGARCPCDERVQSGASAPPADFRGCRAAAATRQCGDAAADGGRGDDPVEPVGAGADRRLHHRSAGDRGAGVAVGRELRAGVGAAAAVADGVCRAGDSRPAVCGRSRSLFAGCRPDLRRRHRGGLQRHGAVDRRRRRIRKRSLQSGAGHRRHRYRHRRIAQHRAGRLRQRQIRQQFCFLGAWQAWPPLASS